MFSSSTFSLLRANSLLAQGELGGGGAEHQGHVLGHVVLEEAVGGQDLAVGDRGEAAADLGRDLVGQGIVFFPRHSLELLDIALHGLEDGRADRCGRGRSRCGGGIAAQRNRLMDKAFRGRHGYHVANLRTAAGLAHDGHVAGIAAEVRDVVMDPLQGGHEVQDAHVAGVLEGRARGGEVGEAEGVEPMVHAHEHDVPRAGEVRAVVAVLLDAVAGGEAAAVHPHQDRALLAVRGRGPHVQVQAVFTHVVVVPVIREGAGVVLPLVGHVLGRVVAVEHRGPDSLPGCGLLRGHETVLAAGRSAVRDAEIGVHAIQDVPLDLAVLSLGDGVVVTDEQALPVLGRVLFAAAAGSHEERREKESVQFHGKKVFCLPQR